MAYCVFVVEKEFHVGPVTHDYYAMKLFNLLDEYNIKEYEKSMDPDKYNAGQPTTFR